RCVVAQAEIALVSRDLSWPVKELSAAQTMLEQHGDVLNAVHACHLQARRFLLVGKTEEAGRVLSAIEPSSLPPARRAAHEMIVAGISMQRLRTASARAAFARAQEAAGRSGIAALKAEVETAAHRLDTPAARHLTRGEERLLLLEDV